MPDRLTEALGSHRRVEYPWREEYPDDVVEGDILVVTDMDAHGPADLMVISFEVEAERRSFLGLLATNEIALAAGADLVLDSEETGLPYRIAVMTHMSGWLWNVQIKRRVGVLADEALDAVGAGRYGVEHGYQRSRRGLPLQNEAWDLRWPALRADLDRLEALAEDCTSKQWDQDIGLPYADPHLLTETDFPDEDTFERMANGTRGFSSGCAAWAADHLDNQRFRAYAPLLAARGRPADSPLPDDCPLPLNAADDAAENLLRITAADALETAPFVKIAVLDEEEDLRFQRFAFQNRLAEYRPVAI